MQLLLARVLARDHILYDAAHGAQNHLVVARRQHVVDFHVQQVVSEITRTVNGEQTMEDADLHDREDFREDDRALRQILIQYPRFPLVGAVLDQRGQHGEDERLRGEVGEDVRVEEDVVLVADGDASAPVLEN